MPARGRVGDDIDDFEPSDSDEDYSENEKRLLQNVRNKQSAFSDSEEEILGVGEEEEDSDEESNISLSDVEGQDDGDDLPNEKAWGKDRRKFYHTDYVDGDYGGFQGKDAELAEIEEQEAKNLQLQLAKQLDDDDFNLDIFTKVKEVDVNKKEAEEIIKTDISKLSKRQKLDLLKKDSPEFLSLIEDFSTKMNVAKEFLHPVLKKYKKGEIPNCQAMDFVQAHYELILNYCTNIQMYLLLKSSKVNIQHHPVIKRLFQYRHLLSQLDSVFEEVVKPQIVLLIQETEHTEVEISVKGKKKKTLKLLSDLNAKEKVSKKRVTFKDVEGEKRSKKIKLNPEESKLTLDEQNENAENGDSLLENEEHDTISDGNEEDTGEIQKRGITYQIAKNKGLTPHRKKEQRNPRVKHRNKFRKAKIRRKGAVREPRTELSRYSGEISGIKASVSKSIKIKS